MKTIKGNIKLTFPLGTIESMRKGVTFTNKDEMTKFVTVVKGLGLVYSCQGNTIDVTSHNDLGVGWNTTESEEILTLMIGWLSDVDNEMMEEEAC